METKQNRSLKLCQLINDRKIDKEVGAEIRKLLIEEVDVNIRDLNRSNNTPLHLATQKSDKICIRQLLKYKPDLQIRNGNGETALDIAQSDEVRELLSSASCDVVEKKFVREIEFQDLSLERLKCLETDPAFKVLKVTRCPNVKDVWERINQDDYKNAITKSSHLFFIAIETQEDEIIKLVEPSVDIKRSIIVQITSVKTPRSSRITNYIQELWNYMRSTRKPCSAVSKKSLIYYKEKNSKQLIEVKFHSPIDKGDFLEKIYSDVNCNFASLFQAINSNIFEIFSGSLLDVKLNNDKERSEVVNCFAKSNDLCHRFFKLFDENLTEDELTARVTSALLFPGDQSLLALLDLPLDFNDEVKLTEDQRRILSFKDSRSYNLIMLAIECNNKAAVKTLLRFSIDLSHVCDDGFWASDLCWEKQHWECLAVLIEAGSPYPYNFDASLPSLVTSVAFEKIKSTMEAAAAFHGFINPDTEVTEQSDIEAVKLFINNNPKLKQVYDRSNKSALTVALESYDPEIYSLLLSERFTPGVDDKYDEALEKCNFKYEIMKENREYFRNAFDEPHLVRLLNKYKLGFSSRNRQACSQVIQKMFLTLNEIPEMVPILQIVSCAEHLNIVFDFDCHSIQEMDPTAGLSSKGVVYPIGGFIYIGAKNHREGFFDVIGTLAHELTHYAMQLTYENRCKPYAINNQANHDIFDSIVDETRKLAQEDPIISTVFTLYPQERWHQELIVRVPHLMSRYKNAAEAFDEARHKIYRLFDFFLSKVLPDVKAQTKVLMHKLEIRKINSLAGTIEKIKEHELQLEWFDAVELEDQIIGSNAPQLTLGMLRQSLDESSHIFISIERISYGSIRERIGKLEAKDFAIVVDCTEMVQKHAETICNVREILKTAGKIILVMAAEETSIVTPKLTTFRLTHVNHNWSDLTDDSQDVLLQKNVNFQGTSCSLHELINRNSDALLDLPLKEFCNSKNFKIGDSLADSLRKFYLPRYFVTRIPKNINNGDQLENDPGTGRGIAMDSNSRPQIEKRIFKAALGNLEGLIEPEQFETVDKTLIEILKESKSIVIISDSAGTGKTSTLNEIARSLKENDRTRWTLLTDLKQHIEMFKTIQGDFKSFQEFVTNIILSGKSIFEKRLFAQFHQESRTNILLDGFDEISPYYKKEVLKALELFIPKSRNRRNQLWITTRSHLELEVEKTLGQLSCSLKPLTREDQIKFIEKFWESDLNSSAVSSQQNLSIIAADLIHKLSSICDSKSSFIGLPILISIVAEIFADPIKRSTIQLENLSFYSIFKQFVGKNIDISIEKGPLADVERIEILKQSEGIVEVHRKIAIAHMFGNKIADVNVEYDNKEWTVEKLARFGLIRYNETKKTLSFIHETFAEYFLTDFIVGNLITKASAVKILVKVLTEKEFEVVRLFLDQAVKELNFNGDKKLCEAVGKQLNVLGRETFGILFALKNFFGMNIPRNETLGALVHISKESCEELFKFMLHAIEHLKQPMLLINERDERENNVLLINIATNSKTMIRKNFDFITQNKNLSIAKETLQDLNIGRENVFHVATHNKHAEIFPTLYESMRSILTTDEIKKMLKKKNQLQWSVLHSAAQFCNENALNDLTKVFRELFSDEEVKAMFVEVKMDGDNSLHVAARLSNRIALKSFFTLLNVFLNPEETKILILKRGFEQRNIFHSACQNINEEIFSTLHECIQKVLTTDEIKKMLREKSQIEWNVLRSAVAYCNEKALNDLVKILKEIFSEEEMKAMLLAVNRDGENSLHIAVVLSNKVAIKSFFKHLNVFMNHDEIKQLIQQRGPQQRNIFHTACYNKNDEIFLTLNECIQKVLSTDEIKKMLREKSEIDSNFLHYAAWNCNEKALNDLVKILEDLFSNEEMKAMLLEVNRDGDNCLHVAAEENNRIALKSFFKHLNVFMNHDEIKQLIEQRGLQQKNIFHSACYNKNDEIFSTLHECIQKVLPNDEIKKMLREKSQCEENILHYAAACCNENAQNDLVKILKDLFSNEEMKAMLLEVNKDGNHSFHVAARLSNKVALKSFFKHFSVIMNPREMRKWIQQTGFEQGNIFHSACHNTNEEIFSTLHESLQPVLTTYEIKKMLMEKDEKVLSILQLAERLNLNENATTDLVKIMKRHFSNAKMKEMKEAACRIS